MASKDQVCRECRIFVKGKKCPLCEGNDLTNTWAGVAFILDPEKSRIAQKMGVKASGKYALKVR